MTKMQEELKVIHIEDTLNEISYLSESNSNNIFYIIISFLKQII